MKFVLKRMFNGCKNIKGTKIINSIAYIYITIPFVIFLLGWVGLRYSIPCTILIFICVWKAIVESPKMWVPEINQDNIIKIICIILFILIWVYFAGIGRHVYQNTDHSARNTVFNILVKYEWPVINYDLYPENINNGPTSLIYYIGFWLPAALVGKKFGISTGYNFQILWAALGILLFYYFLCAKLEKVCLWPLAVVVFFSGLDIVGQYLTGTNILLMEIDAHLDWWASVYQYSSMTTQLFWVFNQAIPAWLCTMMIYFQKENRSIIYILACCMIQATFPFVGLLFLAASLFISRGFIDLKNRSEAFRTALYRYLKGIFTFQNVVGGGIIGLFSFGYLMGNLASNNVMQETTMGHNMDNSLFKYIVFIFLEIGVYFFVLYKYYKKNLLFYFILIGLLIIPPIKVGNSCDFCMRASIPLLTILLVYVIDTLKKSYEQKDRKVFIALIVLLTIGSVTPVHEFTRTIKNTFISINNGENAYIQVEDELAEEAKILNSENFSGPIKDNWFYKYIMK